MPFALITGGSKGIGKAIAETLAVRGYDVLLVARSADLLDKVSAEIHLATRRNCQWMVLDLADDQAAKKVFEWCTNNQFTISVLVNNAGYGYVGAVEESEEDEVREARGQGPRKARAAIRALARSKTCRACRRWKLSGIVRSAKLIKAGVPFSTFDVVESSHRRRLFARCESDFRNA